MAITLLIILLILTSSVSVLCGVGVILTIISRLIPAQKAFEGGTLPEGLEGFYQGRLAGLSLPWRGKFFNKESGLNRFHVFGQRDLFEFKISQGPGLTDPTVTVLKIDYNIPENPFWLRLILDELVQIGPDNYLGKAHLRLISSLPFTVVYFRLSKQLYRKG